MQKVSIIVPIYNVKQYLNRCVESLVYQNVNAEIILVDDGATDGSGELADQLAKRYHNIRVIHRTNGGLSAARNTGLMASKGEFVFFVDADDWIKPNTIGFLVECAEKDCLDVGVADFEEIFENGGKRTNDLPPIPGEVMSGADYLFESLKSKKTIMTVWKSIYRRKFLLENNLFFREGYNHEDEEWSPRVYLAAERVKSIDCIFYNYFIRESGIARQPAYFRKNCLDMISNCYELKKLSADIEDEEFRTLFQNNIASLFLSAVYKGKLIDRKCYDKVNSSFFEGMKLSGVMKKKAQLFILNRKLYYYANKIIKYMR